MRPQARNPRRTGSSAIIVALALMAMLGFAAISIDIGTVHLAQTQLQAGTDAAALAAAARLDRTAEGVGQAPDFGVAMAGRNEVFHAPIALDRASVNTGVWDPATKAFTPSTVPADALAARVDSTLPDVATPFAGIAFQLPFTDVTATSIAVRVVEPAVRLDCFLPVALPQCTWEQMLASGDQGDHHFYFANDSDDNVGWAHPASPTPPMIDAELQAIVEGNCDEGGYQISIGGPIFLANGVQSSTIGYLDGALIASPYPWMADLWGAKPARDPKSNLPAGQYPTIGIIQGPVAIFEYTGPCDAVTFNQQQTIMAFAWGVIFDVYTGQNQHKGFQMYVDTDHEWEVPDGGGGSGGTGNIVTLGMPRLVDGGVQ